jgi:pyridoxamine 5'-phosphate oxidase
VVLLKDLTPNEFVFFTNYDSRKGNEITQNPAVALVFLWHDLERQVRIEGSINKINETQSDAYFYSRPVNSQIGAIVSPQSQPIASHDLLAEKTKYYQANPSEIKRPTNWGGYAVTPNYIEFWQGRRSRLHDRIIYTLTNKNWEISRIAP